MGLVIAVYASRAVASEYQWSPQDLQLRVLDVKSDGTMRVSLDNVSSHTLRLWSESSAWGYGRWRVLHLRDGFLRTYLEEDPGTHVRPSPEFRTMPRGGHLVRTFDMRRWDWYWGDHSLPRKDRGGSWHFDFDSGDVIVVIYDVPMTPDARAKNVWVGTVAVEVLRGKGG